MLSMIFKKLNIFLCINIGIPKILTNINIATNCSGNYFFDDFIIIIN